MSDLAPLTALGAETPRSADVGALRITEASETALASLSLRRGQTAPAPFGLTLPPPGGWRAGETASAFWAARDQWMIEAEGRAGADFAAELARAAPGCSITEQTDGWVCFEIGSGGGAAPLHRLMEKLVALDPLALGPGAATRTRLAHQSAFLVRRTETRLAIWGPRSSAESLWRALALAAGRLERPA